MAAAKKPTVDLQEQEKRQRLAQAQQAIAEGRIPFVHPAVTDPRAVGHAMGMAARKGGLPKYQEPVAGGAPPHMPALEQPHQDGMTMEQQAQQTYGADMAASQHQAMQQHAQQPGSIITPGGAPIGPGEMPMSPHMPPGSSGLLPTDLLPQEATVDPAFQRGAGSMMAQSQPHLAMKYGVVRNRRLIPPQAIQQPQQPQTGRPDDFRQHMRRPADQTMQDLQHVAALQQQPQPHPADLIPPSGLPTTDEEAEAQASQGPGAAAARAGQSPAPSVLLDDDEARKANIQKAMKDMDSLDIDVLREEMIKDILKNPGQREEVEKRCKPLDLDELLMKNKVSQRVPVVPKTETSRGFEPTFESMEGTTEMMLKQLLVQESKSVEVTDSYLLDKYAVMTTAAGLIAINGTPVPTMYDEKGDFNDEKFWIKYTWVLKKPIHMLASLGIHYAWFEARVRKLFKVSAVKNG